MSISINWHNTENTILRYQFEGAWNWADFDNAVEQAFEMSEQLPQRIDVIFDMRTSAGIPDGAIIYLKKFMNVLPANRGQYMVVGNDPQLVSIVDMFNRIFKKLRGRLSHANSMEKAQAYIDYLQAEIAKIAS